MIDLEISPEWIFNEAIAKEEFYYRLIKSECKQDFKKCVISENIIEVDVIDYYFFNLIKPLKSACIKEFLRNQNIDLHSVASANLSRQNGHWMLELEIINSEPFALVEIPYSPRHQYAARTSQKGMQQLIHKEDLGKHQTVKIQLQLTDYMETSLKNEMLQEAGLTFTFHENSLETIGRIMAIRSAYSMRFIDLPAANYPLYSKGVGFEMSRPMKIQIDLNTAENKKLMMEEKGFSYEDCLRYNISSKVRATTEKSSVKIHLAIDISASMNLCLQTIRAMVALYDNLEWTFSLEADKEALMRNIRYFESLVADSFDAYKKVSLIMAPKLKTSFEKCLAEYDIRMPDVIYTKYCASLCAIYNKLTKHTYILHGRNASIAGKQYPTTAGQIVDRLNRLKNIFANPANAISDQEIKHNLNQLVQVAGYIEHELSIRQNATKGTMFFGLGARDESTAELYREIVRDLKIMTDSLDAPAASHNLPRHTVTQSLIEDLVGLS